MYMADISDICMTWWTVAKTCILNGDCNQRLKHAIKLQKYLVKMIKCIFMYLYVFIQPISLIHFPSESNLLRVKHTTGSGQAVNMIYISLLVISTSFFVGFQHLKLFVFSIWRSWSKCPVKPPDLWMPTTNECQDWQVQLGQRGFSSQYGFH